MFGGRISSAIPRRLSCDSRCQRRVPAVRVLLGREEGFLPVREPSSMIRSLIVPRVRISPAWAGTKLMGTVGVSMFGVECLGRAQLYSDSQVAIILY